MFWTTTTTATTNTESLWFILNPHMNHTEHICKWARSKIIWFFLFLAPKSICSRTSLLRCVNLWIKHKYFSVVKYTIKTKCFTLRRCWVVTSSIKLFKEFDLKTKLVCTMSYFLLKKTRTLRRLFFSIVLKCA